MRRIEARFRYRQVGKIWRYTDAALGDALRSCEAYYGRPPSVPEFEHWRDRELELARAAGNNTLQLPSPTPYRRRWGTWEKALLHFGYTMEEAAQRFQQPYDPNRPETEPFIPVGLPIAVLTIGANEDLPLDEAMTGRLRSAYERLPRRSRYVLTTRLGLGVEPLALAEAAKPLSVHMARIYQLQKESVTALALAAFDEVEASEAMRDSVLTTLRVLAGKIVLTQ